VTKSDEGNERQALYSEEFDYKQKANDDGAIIKYARSHAFHRKSHSIRPMGGPKYGMTGRT